jgi:hypothetical protein
MTHTTDLAADMLRLLRTLRSPVLGPFLDEWPTAPRERLMLGRELPVLRFLAGFCSDSGAFGASVVGALCRAAPTLEWRQTYSSADTPPGFPENYGWAEIIGPTGALWSDRLACGFLVLGPATRYPSHYHAAQEWYLPLSGIAGWQQAGGRWSERAPGALIYHASGVRHAMQTGRHPLLALYLWHGAGLGDKARLESTP